MTRSDTPTGMLRAEHRLILRVVDAFEIRLQGDVASAATLADLSDCILFFRSFTDACHHGKENDLLFTAMAEQEPGGAAGLIQLLREEHVEGRALVREMDALLARVRDGEAAAWPALRQRGRGYAEFIRAHIQKEDGGVFEIADDLLRGPACASLCAAYETACSRRFDGRTLDDLEALAGRLTGP